MADNDAKCRFAVRCPMFPVFASKDTLRIFQLHYCNSEGHTQCERFKKTSQGVMPEPTLLPDGSHLANRPTRGG
jgi:hypothetical protein